MEVFIILKKLAALTMALLTAGAPSSYVAWADPGAKPIAAPVSMEAVPAVVVNDPLRAQMTTAIVKFQSDRFFGLMNRPLPLLRRDLGVSPSPRFNRAVSAAVDFNFEDNAAPVILDAHGMPVADIKEGESFTHAPQILDASGIAVRTGTEKAQKIVAASAEEQQALLRNLRGRGDGASARVASGRMFREEGISRRGFLTGLGALPGAAAMAAPIQANNASRFHASALRQRALNVLKLQHDKSSVPLAASVQAMPNVRSSVKPMSWFVNSAVNLIGKISPRAGLAGALVAAMCLAACAPNYTTNPPQTQGITDTQIQVDIAAAKAIVPGPYQQYSDVLDDPRHDKVYEVTMRGDGEIAARFTKVPNSIVDLVLVDKNGSVLARSQSYATETWGSQNINDINALDAAVTANVASGSKFLIVHNEVVSGAAGTGDPFNLEVWTDNPGPLVTPNYFTGKMQTDGASVSPRVFVNYVYPVEVERNGTLIIQVNALPDIVEGVDLMDANGNFIPGAGIHVPPGNQNPVVLVVDGIQAGGYKVRFYNSTSNIGTAGAGEKYSINVSLQ